VEGNALEQERKNTACYADGANEIDRPNQVTGVSATSHHSTSGMWVSHRVVQQTVGTGAWLPNTSAACGVVVCCARQVVDVMRVALIFAVIVPILML